MKHTMRVMLFVAVGVVVAGCSKSTDKGSKARSDSPGTEATQREKAMTATKGVAQSVQEYAYEQKNEFIDASKRELADIQAEMERLQTTIDRSAGAARADAEAKLEMVNDKWAAANAQLDQAAAATEASWEEVQNRYRTSQAALKNSFDEMRQWLSERIDP